MNLVTFGNMDGVGTFSMAKVLQEFKMMTVITKTTGIEEWRKAVGNGVRLQSVRCMHRHKCDVGQRSTGLEDHARSFKKFS